MKQVLQSYRSGELAVREVPAPSCGPGEVLIRSCASLLSVGTERASVELARKSLLGKARDRPDLVAQVRRKVARDGLVSTARAVRTRLDTPVPLGYSVAGVVVQVGEGVTGFAPGDRVAAAGAKLANHAEFNAVPENLCVTIPAALADAQAAFVTLGAIAMHAVRTSGAGLGDCVGVIGLGVIGQLTAQLLRAQGSRVLAIDIDPSRTTLAGELGAELAVVRSDDVLQAAAGLTGGRGLDAVLVCAGTDSTDPIELAGELARDRAKVVAVGAVPLEAPRDVFYAKELTLLVSRSYGPGRYDPVYEEGGVDYPIGYVRWTERRNMESFLVLAGAGSLALDRLITHRFPIDRATEAYDLVTHADEVAPLGVLLTYAENPGAAARTVTLRPAPVARPGAVRVGVVGAGLFATGTLVPAIADTRGVELRTIASARGASARHLGERFGFVQCTSDYGSMLDDPEIDAVFVATRHHQHAEQARLALERGKDVFVEKPLAITEPDLEAVLEAARASGRRLLVGHNRRFAPLARHLAEHFRARSGPMVAHVRVNAGALPADSWHLDPKQGGGRVLSEVSHFVDLLCFLTASTPREVHATQVGSALGGVRSDEQFVVTLRFEDGSVGSILYTASGDAAFSKERIELFGDGRVGVLEDFRSVTLVGGRKARTKRGVAQDKGHRGQIRAFVDAIQTGGPSPVALDETAAAMRATFAIVTSLETGLAVAVPA